MRSSFVISLSPFVLLAAAACDLAFGDPRNLPHPVVYIGRLISWLEPRLRSLFRNEKAAGVLLVVATVGGTYLFARFVLAAAFAIHHAVGVVVAVWMTFTALAARSLHTESAAVARLVEEGNLIEARQRLAWIVGRDTENLDEQEILRALVETVAENTSDGVIAPLFYLMLGGPALGLAYKAVNTLDSMVGYKNDRYLHFGWASARFDDVVNYIPARLTGVLMVCVSPLVGLSGFRALTIMLRDGRNHSSPNSGIPEAAAAGAIGVMLGGTNYYFGKPISKPTIGDSLKPLTLESYRQVVRLMYGSAGLLIVLFLLFS